MKQLIMLINLFTKICQKKIYKIFTVNNKITILKKCLTQPRVIKICIESASIILCQITRENFLNYFTCNKDGS